MGRNVYGAQSYRRSGKRYERGAFVACDDAETAKAQAERLAGKRGSCGAVAFLRRSYAEEFDEGDEPVTLAAFGDVPPEARDAVPF